MNTLRENRLVRGEGFQKTAGLEHGIHNNRGGNKISEMFALVACLQTM
jgi:hypothetical protein